MAYAHIERPRPTDGAFFLAGATGIEPATSGVTGRRSNQLNYAPDYLFKNLLQKYYKLDPATFPRHRDALTS